jgi:hypothetical protein
VKQNLRLTALVLRRDMLIERADRQRQSLVVQLLPLRAAVWQIDARVHTTRALLSNPVVIGVTVSLLLIIGPRRMFGCVKRAAELWLMSRSWLPRIANLAEKHAD